MIESIFFNPWVWIIPVIFAVLILLMLLDAFIWDVGVAFILSASTFIILAIAYFGFILPPYDGTFYQTYRISGEVTTLERAFNAEDGGGLSQTFVVGVEGVDLLIQSNDQRFRTVEVGDDVTMACTKSFEYFVEPWYQCSLSGTR